MSDAPADPIVPVIPVTQQTRNDYADVKAEHITQRVRKEKGASVASAADAPPQRKRGQNHGRDASDLGLNAGGAAQFCRKVMDGRTCMYGERCRYSHDMAAYLATKPPDLGPRCYVWDVHGRCPSGVSCRFGAAHGVKVAVDASIEGAGSADAAPAGKELEHASAAVDTGPDSPAGLFGGERNQLPAQVAHRLGRHKYTFRCDAASRQGGGGGGASTVRDVAATDASDAAASAANVDPTRDIRRPGSSRAEERHVIDFRDKLYVGPLTTVGNLPFRRVVTSWGGADATIGEMALAERLVRGAQGEWALVRRHQCERFFGVQVAASHPDQLARALELLDDYCGDGGIDFVDINMGCPLDLVCDRGMGASLMSRTTRLHTMLTAASRSCALPLTLKMRTGLAGAAADRFAHRLVSQVRVWSLAEHIGRAGDSGSGSIVPLVSAISVHGRTRQQRYSKSADWEYIRRCASAGNADLTMDVGVLGSAEWLGKRPADIRATLLANSTPAGMPSLADCCVVNADGSPATATLAAPLLPHIPVIGNGDVLDWREFYEHQENAGTTTVMLARGALIKPWLPREIRGRVDIDVRSSERLDMLKDYVNYGCVSRGGPRKSLRAQSHQ